MIMLDSEVTFRHSRWINMMYNRLSITKKMKVDLYNLPINGITFFNLNKNFL